MDFTLRCSYERIFNLRIHHVSCRGNLSHKQDAYAINPRDNCRAETRDYIQNLGSVLGTHATPYVLAYRAPLLVQYKQHNGSDSIRYCNQYLRWTKWHQHRYVHMHVLRVLPVNYHATNCPYSFIYQAGDGQRVHKDRRSTGSLTAPQQNQKNNNTQHHQLALSCSKRMDFDCAQKRRQNPTCEAPDSLTKEGSKEGIGEGIKLTLYPCIS